MCVPGATTLELVNMSINPFEVYTWLFSVQRKKKWGTSRTQNKLSCTPQSIQKQNMSTTQSKREKDSEKERRKRRKGKISDPHRALVRSLRSFSESSKNRDTTSTTKSGLLSSCSCWSCKNWPSRNPFSHPKQQPENKIRNKTNRTKKLNQPSSRWRLETPKTPKTKQTHQWFHHFLVPYLQKQGLCVINPLSLHLPHLHVFAFVPLYTDRVRVTVFKEELWASKWKKSWCLELQILRNYCTIKYYSINAWETRKGFDEFNA